MVSESSSIYLMVWKKCYNNSAAGIICFRADVLVKLGISVETSRLKVSYLDTCHFNHSSLMYFTFCFYTVSIAVKSVN